jgi:hypothetical protein
MDSIPLTEAVLCENCQCISRRPPRPIGSEPPAQSDQACAVCGSTAILDLSLCLIAPRKRHRNMSPARNTAHKRQRA